MIFFLVSNLIANKIDSKNCTLGILLAGFGGVVPVVANDFIPILVSPLKLIWE